MNLNNPNHIAKPVTSRGGLQKISEVVNLKRSRTLRLGKSFRIDKKKLWEMIKIAQIGKNTGITNNAPLSIPRERA